MRLVVLFTDCLVFLGVTLLVPLTVMGIDRVNGLIAHDIEVMVLVDNGAEAGTGQISRGGSGAACCAYQQ